MSKVDKMVWLTGVTKLSRMTKQVKPKNYSIVKAYAQRLIDTSPFDWYDSSGYIRDAINPLGEVIVRNELFGVYQIKWVTLVQDGDYYVVDK